MKAKNFKKKVREVALDEWFFYAFLLTMPFSVRKIIYFVPIGGEFSEFTAVSLYVSEIFLWATVGAWMLLLCNKKYNLSNKIFFFISKNNVSRGTKSCFYWIYQQVIHRKSLSISFILAIFLFLSTFWSENKILALEKSFRFLEGWILFVYIYFKLFHVEQFERNDEKYSKDQFLEKNNVPRGTIILNSLRLMIFLGVLQSIVAIFQFLFQKSLGLYFLKESFISPDLVGVAKVVFGEEAFLRSYGFFPHPNILGGFLFLTIIATGAYFKLFHVEQFKIKQAFLLFFQIVALFLTFSKSAWIAFLIFSFWKEIKRVGLFSWGIICSTWNKLYLFFKKKNVPRGTNDKIDTFFTLFHVEHCKKSFILGKKNLFLISFLVLFLLFISRIDFNFFLDQSIKDRLFFINVSRGTFLENPIFGVGAGNYVHNLLQNKEDLLFWQFQPVHNLFLLVLNEGGILFFVGFLYWIFMRENNVPRGTKNLELLFNWKEALFAGMIFIALFDHYFWTIWPGQIIFWLIMSVRFFLKGQIYEDNLDEEGDRILDKDN